MVCEYCKSEVTLERYAVKAAEYRGALEDYAGAPDAASCKVGKVPLRLLGHLATGHSTDVWLAERATRLSERLVVKFLRNSADEGLLRAEQQTLQTLEQSHAKGTDFFATLLPQRVAFGQGVGPSGVALAVLVREPIGFAHTLVDVRRAYPNTLDPRHIVWLWRRVLELLSWVHSSGKIHGALLPQHVLVNARDHAARLVGWSCAANPGGRLTVADSSQLALYPETVLNGGALSVRTDLTMLARCMLLISGSHAQQAAAHIPASLARLLEREASGTGADDAWRLSEEVSLAARESFGAPKFVALSLP